MRPSELITLYLATAAPFGVAYFLRRQATRPRVSTATLMATATGVALAWPLALVANFLGARRLRPEATPAPHAPATLSPHEAKIERAKRVLLAALREVEDLMEDACGGRNEQTRQALFEARESAERYTGLAQAVAAGAEEIETAAPRELELWRAAGRTGEDLQVAARCVARRNAARLLEHRNSVRTELLHALAEVRELAAGGRPFAARSDTGAARRLSEAILEAYGRAIELLSLLDDQRAAMSVARLLDAECARLRRLETFGIQDARASVHAGEPCSTPPLPPTPTQSSPTSSLRRPEASPLIPTHR